MSTSQPTRHYSSHNSPTSAHTSSPTTTLPSSTHTSSPQPSGGHSSSNRNHRSSDSSSLHPTSPSAADPTPQPSVTSTSHTSTSSYPSKGHGHLHATPMPSVASSPSMSLQPSSQQSPSQSQSSRPRRSSHSPTIHPISNHIAAPTTHTTIKSSTEKDSDITTLAPTSSLTHITQQGSTSLNATGISSYTNTSHQPSNLPTLGPSDNITVVHALSSNSTKGVYDYSNHSLAPTVLPSSNSRLSNHSLSPLSTSSVGNSSSNSSAPQIAIPSVSPTMYAPTYIGGKTNGTYAPSLSPKNISLHQTIEPTTTWKPSGNTTGTGHWNTTAYVATPSPSLPINKTSVPASNQQQTGSVSPTAYPVKSPSPYYSTTSPSPSARPITRSPSSRGPSFTSDPFYTSAPIYTYPPYSRASQTPTSTSVSKAPSPSSQGKSPSPAPTTYSPTKSAQPTEFFDFRGV